ncbi:MAG: aromatic ring-hydroxylating dioxygenase subunit alpha [Alphaproteobacteria bacterium]|nr:aromatic ring-hydroxylating dioxygenase subunit alpha [Alphaproteobacteria bacterium]
MAILSRRSTCCSISRNSPSTRRANASSQCRPRSTTAKSRISPIACGRTSTTSALSKRWARRRGCRLLPLSSYQFVMARKGRFLSAPYGAYHQAIVPPIDETMQLVGPGTPGGEYLRRFWHPVAQSVRLDDRPVALRILGEDLVLFRDKSGQLGLLHRNCAHRGTSLEFGKIEEHGLRCCYHGWLFGVDGALLETPAEPANNPYLGRLCQGAYPVVERHGLAFAYFGPPDKKPPLPAFDIIDQPGMAIGHGEPSVIGNVKPCNWLQIMDNVVDPVHEPFLHARHSGIQFRDRDGREVSELLDLGEPEWFETPIGILCEEARWVGDSVWVRSMEYICPNIALVCQTPSLPPHYSSKSDEIASLPLLCRWRVPVDDTTTTEFAYVFYPRTGVNDYLSNAIPGTRSNYGDRSYEERQRYPGDYDAQVSQRSIARHTNEHLAASDKGVAMMRRMVRDGIETVARGEDPKGLLRTPGEVSTYANETVKRLPRGANEVENRSILKAAMRAVFERSSQGSLAARVRRDALPPLQIKV